MTKNPTNPFGPDGLLKDGATVRVTTMMRDAARARGEGDGDPRHHVTIFDPMGRIAATYQHDGDGDATANRRGRRKVLVNDPWGHVRLEYSEDAMRSDPNRVYGADGALVASRPGFVGGDRTAIDAAYADSVRSLNDAWRIEDAAPPPAGAYAVAAGYKAGGACTINGAPGTLQPSGRDGWLVCRASSGGRDSAPPKTSRRLEVLSTNSGRRGNGQHGREPARS